MKRFQPRDKMHRMLNYSFVLVTLLWVIAWLTITAPILTKTSARGLASNVQAPSVQCKIGTGFVRRDLDLSFGIRSNSEAQKIVEEVLKTAGALPGTVEAKAADVANAEACRGRNGIDYILFNSRWLSKLYGNTVGAYWADRAIIAHEVGHLYFNHSMMSLGSTPRIEEQADEFAGEMLAKMGASLATAQVAYRTDAMNTPGSHTHPEMTTRLAAVERGYRRFMKPGNVHPSRPHVISAENGNWRPASGYTWAYPNDANNLDVRWNPRKPHPSHPHVIACEKEGEWCRAPGYVWVYPNDPNNLDVRWNPGEPHPAHPHVIATKEGNWHFAPGYVWVYPNDPNNLDVRWNPGEPHPSHPHVIACGKEGNWCCAPGYEWVNPNDRNDFRVKIK